MITEKDILAVKHVMVGNTYLMATRSADDSGLPTTPENPIIIEREECPYCGAMAPELRRASERRPGLWAYRRCECGVEVALRYHYTRHYIVLGVTTQTPLCTMLSSDISVQEDTI